MELKVSSTRNISIKRNVHHGKSFVTHFGGKFIKSQRAISSVTTLICFDMDSTLVDAETLDMIASEAGVAVSVKEITSQAMNGELCFEEAVRKRLALLKGFPLKRIRNMTLPLMPGAYELVQTLREKGYITGIISGGFDLFAEELAKKLSLDFFITNKLYTEDGQLSGEVKLQVNDNKDKLLEDTRKAFSAERTIAVGDGANDIPMLKAADLGIAFCAKDIVNAAIECQIHEKNLLRVLDFIELKEAPKVP
ncbi:MAG: phosphoserine phosphatase SerB [Nanobdellota archaeon]